MNESDCFAFFILARYKVLALSPKLAMDQRGCKKILETVGLKDWRIG